MKPYTNGWKLKLRCLADGNLDAYLSISSTNEDHRIIVWEYRPCVRKPWLEYAVVVVPGAGEFDSIAVHQQWESIPLQLAELLQKIQFRARPSDADPGDEQRPLSAAA